MSAVPQPSRPRSARPLTGGLAIWIFMTVELVTFGLFLLQLAFSWSSEADVFRQSQAQLHVGSATFGTVVLLVGSWTAYRGALSVEGQGARSTALWFALTALAGVVFVTNKLAEYGDLEGINLSTNGFWFSYLFLTALHLLHVLIGVAGFLWLTLRASKRALATSSGRLTAQAGAAYWHLVDVIWLLLFPILYLMHP